MSAAKEERYCVVCLDLRTREYTYVRKKREHGADMTKDRKSAERYTKEGAIICASLLMDCGDEASIYYQVREDEDTGGHHW